MSGGIQQLNLLSLQIDVRVNHTVGENISLGQEFAIIIQR